MWTHGPLTKTTLHSQDHAGIQEFGFRAALTLMCNNNLEHKEEFVALGASHKSIYSVCSLSFLHIFTGGIDCVLGSMKRHKHHEGVQEYGCALSLSVMAGNHELIESFVHAGGIECIVNAMLCHPRHIGIHEQGCGAIWNFLSSHHQNKALFADAGGTECLLLTMRSFPHDAEVQEQACGAVWNFLSGNSHAYKQLFSNAGGMECLVNAMRIDGHHEHVQEYACGAMLRLMAENNESVIVFTKHGGIEAVVAAMLRHRESAPVLLQAMGVTWHFLKEVGGFRTAVLAPSTEPPSSTEAHDEPDASMEGIECGIDDEDSPTDMELTSANDLLVGDETTGVTTVVSM